MSSGAQWPPKDLPTDPPVYPWIDQDETIPGNTDNLALYAIWYTIIQIYDII